MRNRKTIIIVTQVLLMMVVTTHPCDAQTKAKQPVDYVNNRIGVGGDAGKANDYSNCVIGPQLPFGSINPSPQTKNGEDDGYNPQEPIRGFGQLQVSGTGWGTNGQLFLSPQTGLTIQDTLHDSPKQNETATPYEYGVTLTRYGIGVKLSPSYHSAIYQFQFPASDSASILLDITHNIPMDIKPVIRGTVSKGEVHFDDATHQSLSGYGIYQGGFGGGAYNIYYAAKISKQPAGYGTWINGAVSANTASQALLKSNDRVGAYVHYVTKKGEIIYMKIAVSYKSVEQAKGWLDAEIPGWDYEKTKETAKTIWNNALKKIEIEGGTEKDKTIFYSAFYHTQVMPRNRTNDSRAFDKDVPVWDDHFAVWDTWRTMYPLHALINQQMVSGTVNSFIARFKKYGMVRDAFVNGNDMNNEQGGNNIDNIIADAYVKGVPGIDWNEAYKVLKYDADNQRLGAYAWRKQDSALNTYKKQGWIPSGIMDVSMSLEYNYNDYCIAEVAKGLGKTDDYQYYFNRSRQWTNLWNKDAESDGYKGFIMPKNIDGKFENIDAKAYPGSWKNYFYEASSWNYSYFMPHQFKDLVALNGGNEPFAKKLNYGFENKLINYGNEPAFLAVHSFIYANRPDLTSYWVRHLMNQSFTLEGYPGNDDSGAMSAWYLFSAMGFFPNSGQPVYYLTGPLFTKVKMHMSNGKTLTISAPKASAENIYVQSVKVNGEKLNDYIISHDVISKGAVIEFDMSNTAVK